MSDKAETNGRRIVQIGRAGRAWFQMGDAEPFQIDVIAVYNDWFRQERQYRDTENKIPPDKQEEYDRMTYRFVQELTGMTGGEDKEAGLTLAEAYTFVARVQEEADKLMPFFSPKSREGQSSQKPTVAVNYSE